MKHCDRDEQILIPGVFAGRILTYFEGFVNFVGDYAFGLDTFIRSSNFSAVLDKISRYSRSFCLKLLTIATSPAYLSLNKRWP